MNVDRLRADTEGCNHVTHFLHSGASLMPKPVTDALHAHLELEERIGGYAAEDRAAPQIERTYAALAEMLGCDPDEIALVENATFAWDQVFYGLARDFGPGDRVFTVRADYASNFIAMLQMQHRQGFEILVIPESAPGVVDLEAYRRELDERARLVCITHVPTGNGLVYPAAELGRAARERGVPVLLDACQSAGQMPLDVDTLCCDFLSATGRKFLRGPRGTGFLYARRETAERTEPAFLDLHGAEWTGPDRYRTVPDARRFENWESFVAGKVGLGVAVRYALDLGLEAIERRVRALAERMRSRLETIPEVTVRDTGSDRCAIVTFTHADLGADAIRDRLAEQGFVVGTSTVLSTRLDMEQRSLDAVVRSPVHYYNTEEEIDRLAAAVAALTG